MRLKDTKWFVSCFLVMDAVKMANKVRIEAPSRSYLTESNNSGTCFPSYVDNKEAV